MKFFKKIKLDNLFLFLEQCTSSVFNFCIIVFFSRSAPEYVAIYGIGFAFFLLLSGYFRNKVYNPFLVSGYTCSFVFLTSLRKAAVNPITILMLSCFLIYLYLFNEFSAVLVFMLLMQMEVARVIAIANKKMLSFSMMSALLYLSSVPQFIFLSVTIVLTSMLLLSFLVLFSIVYWCKSDESHKSSEISSFDAMALTLSYFSITSLPLFLITAIAPGAAATFVQVRSLFQPLMLLARVADLLDKRSASLYNFKDVLSLLGKVKFFAAFSFLISLSVFFASLFFFEFIFKSYDDYVLIFSALFSVVTVLMFISKPIETYFYKNNIVSKLVISRVISAAVSFVAFLLIFYFMPFYSVFAIVFSMITGWVLVLLINLYQIYKIHSY